MVRRLMLGWLSTLLIAAPSLAQAPSGQDGFVPASSLPPGQELPAAPFVIASYASFLILMVFYIWTIWRRLGRVEKEMRELERRQAGGSR